MYKYTLDILLYIITKSPIIFKQHLNKSRLAATVLLLFNAIVVIESTKRAEFHLKNII